MMHWFEMIPIVVHFCLLNWGINNTFSVLGFAWLIYETRIAESGKKNENVTKNL